MEENAVPLLPCTAIEATLEFYRTLGFEVTYHTEPHAYGTAGRGARGAGRPT
jgi:catechol 2,3-dioxygenase-like lactoylglutathione lyase family enzyme